MHGRAVRRARCAALVAGAWSAGCESQVPADLPPWLLGVSAEWFALVVVVLVLLALGTRRFRRIEAQFDRRVAAAYAGVPTPLAVIARDEASTVMVVNAALFELFGGATDAEQREAVRERVAGLAPALAGLAEPPASAPHAVIELEHRFERLDGQVFWALVRASRDPLADRPAWLCSLTDVTALQQARERLSEIATVDALTAVLNRRTLEQRLRVEWQRAERDRSALAVLWLDIEQLGRMNDVHGHETGDLALAMAAATCHEALRPTDVLGRWGGDDFVAVLPGATLAAAEAVAGRLRARVQSLQVPVHRADGTVRVTLHPGLAVGVVSRGGGDDSAAASPLPAPDDLLAQARAALKQTKREGAESVAGSR